MKKSRLFLVGMLVVVLVCGLLLTGCSDLFGKEDDSGSGNTDNNLSTSWSQSQWETWFNNHPVTDSSNATTVSTFYSQNGTWCAQTSWWLSLYTTWATGGGGGGGDSLSTSWDSSQWSSWFNSHPASNSSNASAVSTFMSTNSVWISNNSWWSSLYTAWATGGSGGGGGDSLSTSMTQSQWQTWFNNHPYNTSNASTVSTFISANGVWISNNSWWSSQYSAWAVGGSGGGGGGDSDLSTSWSQSQWQTWFNSHPVSNSSNADAVVTFYSQNTSWVSSNSWWVSLYQNWFSSY